MYKTSNVDIISLTNCIIHRVYVMKEGYKFAQQKAFNVFAFLHYEVPVGLQNHFHNRFLCIRNERPVISFPPNIF